MTRLTLLRHAKSSWDNPSLSDLQRPLNERGRHAAPLMGRVCAQRLPAPDLVLLSPSARTQETVRLFLAAWAESVPKAGKAEIRILDDLYLAGMRDWIRIVDDLVDFGGHVLCCGHQPGLGDFASWLDPGFMGRIPTTTVLSYPTPSGIYASERGVCEADFIGSPKDFSD